mmetsp:Transcript_40574/g.65836  ORF Transcript_40574/g.65836 Transcript_40574/m.65836 type:complete len:82 (-) Transcript_40574:1121-1366(-)
MSRNLAAMSFATNNNTCLVSCFLSFSRLFSHLRGPHGHSIARPLPEQLAVPASTLKWNGIFVNGVSPLERASHTILLAERI